MHILPWAQKLPSAAEQEDYAASTAEAASMQNDNRVVHFATSPSSVSNRSKLTKNVFAATTLLLPVLLFVYFCLSSRSKGEPPGLLRRRLASVGDDGTNIFGSRQSVEECEQFLSANIPVYDENTVGPTYPAVPWEELSRTENNRESRRRKRKSSIDGERHWRTDPWMLDTLPSTQVADSPNPFMEPQPPSKKRTLAHAGNFSDQLHATPHEFVSNRKLELSGTAEETMAESGSTRMPENPSSWLFNSLLGVENTSLDCVSEQIDGEAKCSDVARGNSGEGAAALFYELGEQGIQGADILQFGNFPESYNLPPNHCPGEAAKTEPLQEVPAFLPPSHIPDPTSHDIGLNSQRGVNATLCSNLESSSDELLLPLLKQSEYYLPGSTVEQQNSNRQHLDFTLDSSREEGIGLPFDTLTNQGIQGIQKAGVLQPDEIVGIDYLLSGQHADEGVSVAPLQGLPPYSLQSHIPESTSQEQDLRSNENVRAMLWSDPKSRECDEWHTHLDQLGDSLPNSSVEQQNSRNVLPGFALDSSGEEGIGLPFDKLANEGGQCIENTGILQPGETVGSNYLFSGQCDGDAGSVVALQGLPPYSLQSHIPESTSQEQDLRSNENVGAMLWSDPKSRECDELLAHLLDDLGNSLPNSAVEQQSSRDLLPGFAASSSGNGDIGSDPNLLVNHGTQGVGILQSGRSSEKHHFIPGQDYGQVVNVMMPVHGRAPLLVPSSVPHFTTHDSGPNAQQNVHLASSTEPWNSAFAFLPTFYDPKNASMVSISNPAKKHQAQSRAASTKEAVISDEACRQHPYWRLPKVSQRLEHKRFSWEKALFSNCREKLVDLLMPVRELLAKPELEEKELATLMQLGEKLLNEAVWSTTIGTGSDISWKVAQGLGRRFLVADYLWCICEVVGPPMEKDAWWGKLMGKYLHIGYLKSYASSKSRGLSYLVRRFISALDEYRKGKRPQPRDVVMLKQAIFFKLHRRSWFRDPSWEPWRQDNNASLGSS